MGMPRAGSTWLHRELNFRGDCKLAKNKESFYFQGFLGDRETRETYWQNYADSVNDNAIALLGDITPSNGYATLDQLLEYSKKLSELGLIGKPVLTLRDPINQVVSLTQFQKSMPMGLRSKQQIDEWVYTVINETAIHNQEHLNAELIMKHGISAFNSGLSMEFWPTWEKTITNYLTVFGEVYIQFFEEMFNEEENRSLQNWLGIEYKPMNFTQKIFSFPSPNQLSLEEKKKVFSMYPKMKDNYDYAVNVWGQEKIDSIWWNPYK